MTDPSGSFAKSFGPAPIRLCRIIPSLFLAAAIATHAASLAPAPEQTPPAINNAPVEGGPDAADQQQILKFEAQLLATLTYDDNIFIQHTGAKKDWYGDIAPTLAAGVGNFRSELATFAPIPHFLVETGEEDLSRHDFAYVSYTPDVVLYSKYHAQNTVDHEARLAARNENERWNLQGQVRFQNESSPNIDVGRRIKQTYYTTDVNAAYALTGKLTIGSELYGQRAEYSGGLASTDGRGSGYIGYQITPKVAVGVEATGGYLDVASGSNQTYEQPLAELKFTPDDKLTFMAQAGEEIRQFKSNIPNRTHFIFDTNAYYQFTDSTLFTLTAKRDTTASAEYSGENIVASTYEGSIRQRFVQRIYLGAAGGYVRDNYENNEQVAVVVRHDDYYFYRGTISSDVGRHATVELAYEHRENDSSIATFSFKENLASAAVSILF